MKLTLCIYTPSHFIKESKREKYAELYDDTKYSQGFTQANRERGIRRLTAINLMKRMESSAFSFNLTLKRVKELIDSTLETIEQFERNRNTLLDLTDITNIYENEFDEDDLNTDDIFSVGRKVKIQLEDMDVKSWKRGLEKDRDTLELLTLMVADITPEYDNKLQELLKLLSEKVTHPFNPGNQKVIIFTAFADTAKYI